MLVNAREVVDEYLNKKRHAPGQVDLVNDETQHNPVEIDLVSDDDDDQVTILNTIEDHRLIDLANTRYDDDLNTFDGDYSDSDDDTNGERIDSSSYSVSN